MRAFALVTLVALVLLAGPVFGQGAQQPVVDDSPAARIDRLIADPGTTTPELEVMREDLVKQRNAALETQKELQPAVDEINARIKALGEPPAEGVTEPPETAARRRELNQELANAMAPVLDAKDAYERVHGQIAEIDRIVRSRFSAELMSRGSTPLHPSVWITAVEEIGAKLQMYRDALRERFSDPVNQRIAARRLPGNGVLLLGGILVTLVVRRWLMRWVDERLLSTRNGRAAAWIVALRNLSRLIVPVVAAGLLFAALDPEGLVARAGEGRFFEIPGFILILIGAFWLAASLFAPRLEAHRLLPLDNNAARRGMWLVLLLGGVLALARYGAWAIGRFDFSPDTQTAIFFPLVLLGAAGLWRAARLIDGIRRRLIAPTGQGQSPTAVLGLRFLQVLTRLVRAVAVAGPLLALAGYLPAGAFLVFPTIMTLGLLGAGVVVYDLLEKTALTVLAAPNATQEDAGLIPVVVGALVGLASLPLLALIWGARRTDLAETWARLNEGVTFGGMRLSVSVILTLVAVFALGAALTRLVQTVLRGSVLPRTRLDAGGKNAVLAGIGYLGFVLAALAAVGAAGLDLSNIAIVAGALSVGIGFGLQNVVSNFVSGIILLVERPVKEGDWIEVGGFSGYVKGINVRATEIQTFDRASVILPNSDLVAGTVLNRTHTGTSGRVQVPIGVSYEADPRQVEAILLAIAEAHPLVLEDPSPVVLFMGFSLNTMDFEIRCWLRDVNFSLSARSDINFEIVSRFRAEGIEFRVPPPVQHVHRLDEVSAEFLVAAQAGKAAEKDAETPAAKKA
jgi:potassium efflux system protein